MVQQRYRVIFHFVLKVVLERSYDDTPYNWVFMSIENFFVHVVYDQGGVCYDLDDEQYYLNYCIY